MKNILDEKLTIEWDKYNPSFSDVSTKTKVKWNCSKCFNSWEAVIANRLKGSGCPYCSGRLAKPGVNDLQTLFSDLSEQWSHKNGDLKPSNVKPNSNIKVWWVCDKNHEWEATIASRVRQNLGCPICAGKKILAGFNDFATHYPDLLKEWDFEKNVMSPQNIASQSHKEVWWVCSENHSWLTRLSNRTAKNSGCPYCSGNQPVPGLNDFLSNYPHLLKEWDFEKNKNAVTNFSGGSGKKVWWKCHRGHGWEAAIKDRTVKERGCPICANRQVLKGFNDLSTKSLTLSKEWHPTKNAISPEEITAGSDKKVWWMCDKNHEWEATVDNRSKGQSCPYCSSKKVLPGFNDLATTSSHLVDEWDFEKNLLLTPHEVTSGSSKKVWWKCKKNHSWEATPNDRKLYGCLDCYRKTFVSQPEKDIKEFLQQYGVKVIANSRHLINKELDLYLPDYNLAIEFNGLYWHDEKHKTKNYHYDKWLACKNKNVQLIQVWEDDWNCNPELIKNMILHKIGASTQQKIYARKTETVILNKNEAETFLKQNHIQGFVTGSFYLGLKTIPQKLQDEQEIVSVLVMKKEEKEKHYSLLRYATSRNVVGGFTKLLNYFERTCHPIRITTFSDNCVSDGKLYKSNSFSEDKILAPDYMYVVKGRRVHKFNYRLKKFKNNPNLQYIEGLTEKQLADLNNLNRIWDAGKTRWVKCYDDRKKI